MILARYSLTEFPDLEFPVVQRQASGLSPTVTFEGWEWFVLLAATYQINNVAGGAQVFPSVIMSRSQFTYWFTVSPFSINIGGTQNNCFAFGCGELGFATGFAPAPLPTIINDGQCSLTIGWQGGDANTIMTGASLVIGGMKHRSKRP